MGEACVDRFRGMFAFALWDRNRETLFLARDRLGVKPLHYAYLPDGQLVVRLGTEVAARCIAAFRRDIDPHAVEEYFALGYVPEPRTIFAAARKLPPAHTLTVVRGRAHAQPRRYWDPRFSVDNRITAEDAATSCRRGSTNRCACG